MVVWLLVWSCVMVLITFELASLILSRTKQDTAAVALTAGYLTVLRSHLRLQDFIDAAIWAVGSIAWHNHFRLGESISSKSIPFYPSRHVYRACPGSLGKVSSGREWMNLFIPFTKTWKDDLNCFNRLS
ncbi:hypothetical protein EDD85DRAFT_587214 [Armillaria nabsnona]|nr:hypothetical protein EDD85DRAFT_587214 [Armillaria nabsnona]